MKKYIVNILLFFVIIALMDLGVGFAGDYFQSHAKGGPTRETNDLVMVDRHDVLIFGSSRCEYHYDTPFISDTLGLDVYNAGVGGNGVVLSYGLLSLILERYNPQLVLFDVEPAFDINIYEGDNNHKRYLSFLKPYYRHEVVSSIIKTVSEEEWCKVHSGMMRYNTSIIFMIKDMVKTIPLTNRGFIPREGVLNYEPELNEKQVSQIDNFKLECLENMILLAQSKDVPIAVLASPKFGRLSSEELTPAFDICRRHNVPIIDHYSDSLFIQHKDWFKDVMHLNATGAREYSRVITAEISRLVQNYTTWYDK